MSAGREVFCRLEDTAIREAVCAILKGGKRAFRPAPQHVGHRIYVLEKSVLF